MQLQNRISLGVLTLAVMVAFSGCAKKADEGEAAATVNGETITIPQLNRELDKLGNLDPDQAKQAANKLLTSMVDQQLLAQKAVTDKLDQDPAVMVALEAARKQVLARAVVEKMTESVAKPTEQEISAYFNNNPLLFANRHLYRLQEISVQVTPDNLEAVKAKLAGAANLNDFVAWLKEQSIPARLNQMVKPAEQLPTELLPRLAQMKEGQAVTAGAPGAFNILVLAGAQPQPVTMEQAKTSIERYLTNSKKREVAASVLKDIRAKAKIEYLGAYADAGKEAGEAQSAKAAPEADSAPAMEYK